jgi:hypothetical protein
MAQNVIKGGVGTVVILSLSPRRLGFYFPNPQWPFSVTRVADAVYVGRGLGFGKILRQVNILIIYGRYYEAPQPLRIRNLS